MNFLFTRQNIHRPPIPYIPFHILKETHTHDTHEITYQHRDIVQLLRVKLVGKKRSTYDPYNDYEHIVLQY
jgi:hypothetical protein